MAAMRSSARWGSSSTLAYNTTLLIVRGVPAPHPLAHSQRALERIVVASVDGGYSGMSTHQSESGSGQLPLSHGGPSTEDRTALCRNRFALTKNSWKSP